MTEPLAPQYNPSADRVRALRLVAGARDCSDPSTPAPAAPAEPYVIMMPPPNVTAVLHMGHGLNNTVQDVLVRFERMRGRRALWLPGTDHAGIATQNVVERLLAKEGLTRFDLGREAFVERVWAYVRETGAAILEQLKAIGCSADWSRTYFTLDDGLSPRGARGLRALYEQGLVYRGHYIINWCPRCLTALSDEEAEKEETDGQLWHLRYPLADGSGHVTVATTRPETMLGDTAVAVHPEDERYRDLIGREVRLPLVDRLDPDRRRRRGGSRVRLGRREGHARRTTRPTSRSAGGTDLPGIDVMTPEARISLAAPERFQGLDRYEARTRVVAEFEAAGLLEQGRAAPARGGPLLPLRHRGRAAALRPVVRADGAARPARARGRTATAPSASSPSAGARTTPTGWRASATGASPASSGGATAFRCGTARPTGAAAPA